MSQFATWLSQTSLSLTFQVHEWIIPAVQSVHIIAIGIVLSAVLMVGSASTRALAVAKLASAAAEF